METKKRNYYSRNSLVKKLHISNIPSKPLTINDKKLILDEVLKSLSKKR